MIFLCVHNDTLNLYGEFQIQYIQTAHVYTFKILANYEIFISNTNPSTAPNYNLCVNLVDVIKNIYNLNFCEGAKARCLFFPYFMLNGVSNAVCKVDNTHDMHSKS